jgi:hypothetical protein
MRGNGQKMATFLKSLIPQDTRTCCSPTRVGCLPITTIPRIFGESVPTASWIELSDGHSREKRFVSSIRTFIIGF